MMLKVVLHHPIEELTALLYHGKEQLQVQCRIATRLIEALRDVADVARGAFRDVDLTDPWEEK